MQNKLFKYAVSLLHLIGLWLFGDCVNTPTEVVHTITLQPVMFDRRSQMSFAASLANGELTKKSNIT